ncbi:transcription factor HY5-like isoform X1 [Rhodamnia argentea]|uniref:Transcription factor HY5-like isoform X1 n=1 Tax=Rhodamnia argentea TaxID=178133 RepID=A0A8B8NDZ3_9MYRT|nr:transcription factor HY5-like isoform X1 [Rhodamnia argentea]
MSAERHGDGSRGDVASSVQAGMEPTGSSSSSSWRTRQDGNDLTSPSCALKKNEKEENDEDLFMVPDMEARPAVNSTGNSNAHVSEQQEADHAQTAIPGKRRRGRNPVDKEYKRLKRLLRNRVSAQQARERKKVYVNELESRAGELVDKNSKLEEKISTLINENTMLRKILMNTRPKVDDGAESSQ